MKKLLLVTLLSMAGLAHAQNDSSSKMYSFLCQIPAEINGKTAAYMYSNPKATPKQIETMQQSILASVQQTVYQKFDKDTADSMMRFTRYHIHSPSEVLAPIVNATFQLNAKSKQFNQQWLQDHITNSTHNTCIKESLENAQKSK